MTGNIERARRSGALWAKTYPRAVEVHALLSGINQCFGDDEKSAADAKRAIEADPNFPTGYVNRLGPTFFCSASPTRKT